MKYLIPALLASALIVPGAAFADEAMHQDHAAIHHTHHAVKHAEHKEKHALRHGNVHRAVHEQHKVNAHKAVLHEENRELHHDRVEGHE